MIARTGGAESSNGFAATIAGVRGGPPWTSSDHSQAHYAPWARAGRPRRPSPEIIRRSAASGCRKIKNSRPGPGTPGFSERRRNSGRAGLASRRSVGRGSREGPTASVGRRVGRRPRMRHIMASSPAASLAHVATCFGRFIGPGWGLPSGRAGARCNRRSPGVSIHRACGEDLQDGASPCQDRPAAR
jgi:hypothetical protein